MTILATIKKLDGTHLDHGNFASQEAAMAWFQPFIDKKRYGNPAYSYQVLVSEAVPAVYEEQNVLVQDTIYEEREILDAEGKSLEPPYFETILVSPAVYEMQMVEIEPEIPAVYETIQVPAEYEIVIEDVTAAIAQEKINKDALKYLADTDWLVIREVESGVPCPLEIKQARAAARASIIRS